MDIISLLKEKARANIKTIVLPEGADERILQAAQIISHERIANLIILGRMQDVVTVARKYKIDLKDVRMLDHLGDAAFEDYAKEFCQLRAHKNISLEEARAIMQNPVYFSAMMVRKGRADGFVAGAVSTTRDVAKAAIYCLGVDRNITTASSCFLMIVPDCSFGEEGIFIFADCGIVPEPTAKQLADIAVTSARLFRQLVAKEPKIAMLSFSTRGSGSGESVNIVKEATKILKDANPSLWADGELQADAAIIPEVARRKVDKSSVAGAANVLIFPNLDAGNISYKLVQRLAKAQAIGPLLQGLNYPCSDLSRGCSINDIVNVVTVTAVRAQ